MPKTFRCKLCGEEVRANAIPKIIAKEEFCVGCYRTKYRALRHALKEFTNA